MLRAALTTLLMLTSGLAAEAQARRVDAAASDLALTSARFLASLPNMSFRWFVTHDDVLPGGRRLTFIRSGRTVMVRSQGFRIEAEREGALRRYTFDGSDFTVSAPAEKFFATVKLTGGLDIVIDRIRENTGTVLPLWSLMSARLPDRILAEISRGAVIGRTKVVGQDAIHLAFVTPYEDWEVWIAADPARPLPLMIVGTEKLRRGAPQYRAILTEWSLEPPREPVSFRFEPGPDDVRVTWPRVVAERASDGPQAK
ncbi:DUF2092 domain-containing protein [Alsobacter sp. R-9]